MMPWPSCLFFTRGNLGNVSTVSPLLFLSPSRENGTSPEFRIVPLRSRRRVTRHNIWSFLPLPPYSKFTRGREREFLSFSTLKTLKTASLPKVGSRKKGTFSCYFRRRAGGRGSSPSHLSYSSSRPDTSRIPTSQCRCDQVVNYGEMMVRMTGSEGSAKNRRKLFGRAGKKHCYPLSHIYGGSSYVSFFSLIGLQFLLCSEISVFRVFYH